MPPTFCLLKQHADELKRRLTSGELDIRALSEMSSADRRTAFADVVGDANAEHLNASFESRLLLKNQQKALQSWVESQGTLKPAIKRDMLSRVERLDRVLDPADRDAFLSDLAKQKLGFGVTMEEAGKITGLAKDVSDAKASGNAESYMQAHMAFKEYVDGHLIEPVGGLRGAAIEANRAFALTWPTTVIKLMSAWSNIPLSMGTDAVALGVSKTFPDFAEGVGRYGSASAGTVVRSQAAGLATMWTDGVMDMGRLLMNKPSNLDLLHSEKPAVRAWYQYSGSLHAAIKAPVRYFEYGRALYRYTAESITNGENPKDIAVMMRNSTAAFKDANRFIFQEDNVAAKTWNGMIGRLERVDPETGKANPAALVFSTALQLDQPIVKTPTNILADASEHVGGLLLGPSRVAWNAARGLEGLKPVERNAVIRQISKGTVGAALMTLYYFKRDQIELGGFYQDGERRKPGDVPAMGMRVFGHDVPKPMLHSAAVYPMQYAATMGKVFDAERQQTGGVDADGVRSAFEAATLGLINEVPIIGGVMKDARDFLSAKTIDEFIDRKVASMVSPGILQWFAIRTDDAPKRYPHGLAEHLEANIPGLRQNVPDVKRPRAPRR